jgi:predicted AAA+ superfamily ATPase
VRGVELRGFLEAYGDFFYTLSKQKTNSLPEYMSECIKFDDNLFTRQAAGGAGRADLSLWNAAENDVYLCGKALLSAEEIKCVAHENFGEFEEADINDNACGEDFISKLPQWSSDGGILDDSNVINSLSQYYKENGCGIFARYGALRWRHGALHGVENPDTVHISGLKGYEYERSVVVDNTLQFLDGNTANNMLLYGDRGTGKSSTVKAVSNEFRSRGLRIIEVPKDNIADFSGIIEKIADLPLYFIIFIDDLSFESDDDNYTALKAVLEGGLAARPKNTVIYATSNRRHFVKESFSEREGDDVHAADAMQEKLSLADRFGITVTFSSPDQKLYLNIVDRLADDIGLEVGRETLERGALQWALLYNGRSPRTARQYVDWAQARLKSGRNLVI